MTIKIYYYHMKLRNFTKKGASVILVVFLAFSTYAQETKETWRQTAEELLETYLSVSIDPYRGITKEEWDRRAEIFLDKVDSANNRKELYYALRYFGALGNDGHFNFPDMGVYNRHKIFQKDDRLFPLIIKATQDDRVFVMRDFSGLIPDHAELLEVNGIDVAELSRKQHELMPYEPNYTYAYMNEKEEPDFRAWVSFANYLFCENIQGPFEIKFVIDGEVKMVTINAMERHTLHKMSKSMRNNKLPFFGKFMKYTQHNDSIAVLDIDWFWGKNPFMSPIRGDKRFERVLKKMMKRVNRDEIEHLVVDIRSNPGGYANNVYVLMSYFAPDMVYDDKSIHRISAAAKEDERGARILDAAIKMIYGKSNEGLQKQTIDLYKSMPEGALFKEDTLMSMAYSPEKPKYPYQGKVYVLTNSSSFSASTMFCNYFRKSGVGLIVGESPAGYSIVTGGPSIPIRNELAKFMPMRVPHSHSNPLDEKGYHYIIPDIPIENDFNSWINGDDSRLSQLLKMIEQHDGQNRGDHR